MTTAKTTASAKPKRAARKSKTAATATTAKPAATATAKPEESKTDREVPVLAITAKPKRFRRAGMVFTQEPTLIAIDALSEEQIAALKSEPMLVVEDGSALLDAED